jgi:hypothetical protein
MAGNADIKGGYQSLAAKLVEQGVPIVIGMAGEVADGACRIFTRKFYEALLTKSEITLASARGRRAAMIFFTDTYKSHVEWARPTLFMAKGVSPIIKLDADASNRKISEIPSKYIENPAALCDRFLPLQAYQKFRNQALKSGSAKLLAYKGEEADGSPNQLGKTRLLEEIAAHAVMDGFIPCTLLSNPPFEASPNLLLLALSVADSMDQTRDHFSTARLHTSKALDLGCWALNKTPLAAPETKDIANFEWQKDLIIRELRTLGEPGQPPLPRYQSVRASILADFRQLQTDIESVTGEKRIPLLLMDDLHKYEGVASVLLDNMIDGHGLGDQNLVIPMIFTYSIVGRTAGGEIIKAYINKSGKYIFDNLSLSRISDPHEEKLAYCQYLLSRDPPLAVNWRSDKSKEVKELLEVMREKIKGVPSLFKDGELGLVFRFARGTEVLLEADDEHILNSLN